MLGRSRAIAFGLLSLCVACQPSARPASEGDGAPPDPSAPAAAADEPAAASALAPPDNAGDVGLLDPLLLQQIQDIRSAHGGGPPIWYDTRPPVGEFGAWPMSAQMRQLMQMMGRPGEVELREYSLPLNNPAAVPASDASHMRDDDKVVGILIGGRARAYPWWILTNFHVVNDTIDHTPVYVALCEVCSGAAHFDPVLDGWPLDFRVCGANNGTFFVCDFQTKSAWTSFSGAAFGGPLKGRRLLRRPVYQATWAEWRDQHPDTDVAFMSAEVRERPHGKGQHMGKPVIDDQLQYSIWNVDQRLAANELVFGLLPPAAGGRGRVYTLAGIRAAGGLIQTAWGGTPIAFVYGGAYRLGCFVRQLDGVTLELTMAARDPLRLHDQLGNVWDEWGQAVGGPAQATGARLAFADGYLTEWYEWINHYPESDVQPEPGSEQKYLE